MVDSVGIALNLQRFVGRNSMPPRLQYFRGLPAQFAAQLSPLSFHQVVYFSITSPVFARFLSYWQDCLFRNISACRFPRHACFASFVKMCVCHLYICSRVRNLK